MRRKEPRWRRRQRMEGAHVLSRDLRREAGDAGPSAKAARRLKGRIKRAGKQVREREQNERMMSAELQRQETERQVRYYEDQLDQDHLPRWIK